MSTPPEPSAGKKAAFACVLVAAPLVLLLGAELAGRAAISLIYGPPGKSYGIFMADSVLGHFPRPNSYNHLTTLNDKGFRNTEDVVEPRPAGAWRVVTYGGSTTFCPKLTTEQCWSYQLEKRLRAGDGNAGHQVLNGGVVLWSLGHVLERAKRDLPALRPDAVIIYSGFNEPANAGFLRVAGTPIEDLVAAGRYGVAAANYPSSDWLHLNSIAFKVARSLLLSAWQSLKAADPDAPPATADKPPDTVKPEILANYLAVLERLVALVRAHGAEPIFVIQASSVPMTGSAYSLTGAETVCRLGGRVLDAREAVASYGGPVADLFGSSIHYSAKGADVLAEYLYDRLYRRSGFSVCDRL